MEQKRGPGGRSPDVGFVLIREGFDRHARRLELDTRLAQAKALGVDRISLWRVLNGEAKPGMRFMAKAMLLFRAARFEELFEPWERPPPKKRAPSKRPPAAPRPPGKVVQIKPDDDDP